MLGAGKDSIDGGDGDDYLDGGAVADRGSDRAEREGWHIVGTHADAAISGARMILHPGDTRGVLHATLRGSLMGISDFANDNPQPDASRVITSAASAWFGVHSRSVGQMDSASSPA